MGGVKMGKSTSLKCNMHAAETSLPMRATGTTHTGSATPLCHNGMIMNWWDFCFKSQRGMNTYMKGVYATFRGSGPIPRALTSI